MTGSPAPGLYSGTVRATNGIAPDATYPFGFIVRPPVPTIDFTLPEYVYWSPGSEYPVSLDRSLRYESLTPTICTIIYTNGPNFLPGGSPSLVPHGVGVCTVRARAAYTVPGSGTAPIPVVRSTTVVDHAPGVVKITSPVNWTLLSAPANIVVAIDVKKWLGGYRSSDVHDPHQVDVKIDGGAGCSAYGSPFTCTISNVAAGNHTLVATAYEMVDGFGVAQAVSDPVIVQVKGAAALAATAITAPAANATFFAPATIPITVTATDPASTITKVQYYNGPQLIGTATTAPFSFTWTAVPTGTYTLTAKASSASGLVTVSPSITIVVEPNAAPPLALFDFNATWSSTGFIEDGVAGF
jgi:hypothetical protein